MARTTQEMPLLEETIISGLKGDALCDFLLEMSGIAMDHGGRLGFSVTSQGKGMQDEKWALPSHFTCPTKGRCAWLWAIEPTIVHATQLLATRQDGSVRIYFLYSLPFLSGQPLLHSCWDDLAREEPEGTWSDCAAATVTIPSTYVSPEDPPTNIKARVFFACDSRFFSTAETEAAQPNRRTRLLCCELVAS